MCVASKEYWSCKLKIYISLGVYLILCLGKRSRKIARDEELQRIALALLCVISFFTRRRGKSATGKEGNGHAYMRCVGIRKASFSLLVGGIVRLSSHSLSHATIIFRVILFSIYDCYVIEIMTWQLEKISLHKFLYFFKSVDRF